MTDNLKLWWSGRSKREQRLLLVMFGLIALVLVWLLAIRPLSDALDAARTRHGQAVIALAEAKAQGIAAGRIARLVAVAPLPVDSLLARTSAEAGFANARINTMSPARASVTIEAARPQAVLGWVDQLEAQGVSVQSLTARVNQDRTIFVEAVFQAGRES